MNVDDIRPGLWVRTHSVGKPTGMLIAPKHLAVRRDGMLGQVTGWVAGHGGDVYWVRHQDPDQLEVGVYGFWELEPAEAPVESPKSESILD